LDTKDVPSLTVGFKNASKGWGADEKTRGEKATGRRLPDKKVREKTTENFFQEEGLSGRKNVRRASLEQLQLKT